MTSALLRPLRQRQTYRNLAYLALAPLLGVVELALLAGGIALALLLLVTLVGVAVLGRTVDAAFALARLERRLTTRLLGAQLPLVRAAEPPPGAGIPTRLKVLLCCPTTWSRLAYLLARLPLGAATLAAAAAPLVLGAVLLAAPAYADPAAGLALAAVGSLSVAAGLHLVNALARVWARLGAALLPAAV